MGRDKGAILPTFKNCSHIAPTCVQCFCNTQSQTTVILDPHPIQTAAPSLPQSANLGAAVDYVHIRVTYLRSLAMPQSSVRSVFRVVGFLLYFSYGNFLRCRSVDIIEISNTPWWYTTCRHYLVTIQETIRNSAIAEKPRDAFRGQSRSVKTLYHTIC